jgi:hypothetical protein
MQTAAQKGFLRTLPLLALFCLLISTIILVALEVSYGKHFWSVRESHSQRSLMQYCVPILVFLPWGYCLRGLGLASKMATRQGVDSDLRQLVVHQTVTLFWAYMVLIVCSEFFLGRTGTRGRAGSGMANPFLAGGPRKLGVAHSIAFCAIEWGHDVACGTQHRSVGHRPSGPANDRRLSTNQEKPRSEERGLHLLRTDNWRKINM